jgi:hypothetical protein
MHLYGILWIQLPCVNGSDAEAIIIHSQAFAIAKCHAKQLFGIRDAEISLLRTLLRNTSHQREGMETSIQIERVCWESGAGSVTPFQRFTAGIELGQAIARLGLAETIFAAIESAQFEGDV